MKNLFLIAFLCLISSCAFLLNDKTVDVAINSNPAGADIVIDGRSYGRTPATLILEPKSYTVVVTKEGYGSAQIKLEAWQAIRRKNGEGGRCVADALGTMLIVPAFSFLSVYCRDFKESEYLVNIPYLGAASSQGGASQTLQNQQPQSQYQNYYYQPYNYNGAATSY